jgi:Flp pilus assembly protein TadG
MTQSSRDSGQTLVEFTLVIPLFLSILIAIVEFAFVFNAILATNYAARDAALIAAEAGNTLGADCSVLQTVEADMGMPANAAQIQRVEIFRTSAAGDQMGSATVYSRTGAFDCGLPDGTTVSLPYTLGTDGYPVAARCNVLIGCSGQPLHHVGVRVTYRHTWRTPFGTSFGPFMDVVRSNSMRMEPVL